MRLFAGGPVQPDAGFIVHSADYHRPGTIDIDGRVAMTANPEVLRDIGHHQGPRQSLVAFGYAGWGPGQLEGELALGGWFTVPEDSESGIRCRSRQTVGRGDETPHNFALIRPCAASRFISTTRAPTPIWRRISPTNWSAIFRCGWNGCPTCSTSRASWARRASMRMAACWRRTATRISGVACATATWTVGARRANAGW